MKYVPSIVLVELEDVKAEDGLLQDHEAFRELIKYSRIGRQLERNFRFNFKKKLSQK